MSVPVGFTFLPDGRILVIEKLGAVRLSAVGSNKSVVVFTVPNLTAQGERDLLGVAVDPAFRLDGRTPRL